MQLHHGCRIRTCALKLNRGLHRLRRIRTYDGLKAKAWKECFGGFCEEDKLMKTKRLCLFDRTLSKLLPKPVTALGFKNCNRPQ